MIMHMCDGTEGGDYRDIGRGEQVGRGQEKALSQLGSKGCSTGVKQAFVSSKKQTRAFPPLVMPKRIASNRSWEMGNRCAAWVQAKHGHDWMICSTV